MMSSPRRSRRSVGVITVCFAAVAMAGCTKSGAGEDGKGGASTGGSAGGGGIGGSTDVTGTGGTPGTGGTTGTGGTPGTGGATASGGTPGTGGATGTGGTSSSGGATGNGGATGAGGATGTGGATGRGGAGTGGSTPAGGTTGSGGVTGTGGATGRGGSGTGGNTGAGGTSSTCPPATPLTGGKQYCSNTKGSAGGGYNYELWASGNGSGCMTVYGVDANFSATWTNVGDFLARIGLAFDQTKTPAQIGIISSDFAETKTGNDGLVYVGIYGWTLNPLREYYILDDWGSTKPADTASDGTPRTHVGVITVDGDTYDVWSHTRVNKPNITGKDQTFDQYFSVRQAARQCGHISISEHFSKWIDLGLQLGNLEEAMLLVEAQDGTGTIAFTTATVVVK
jgi:endo-1,4-beta-xylanase